MQPTYEFFIASRWRNREQVLDLTEQIRAAGRSVYCFVEGDGSNYALKDKEGTLAPETFMAHFEAIPNWRDDPAVREVFEVDMRALKASSTLILLLPAGKSAHLEAGIAYGLGKRLVLIGEQTETESLYLIFDAVYPTIDAFIASLAK